MEGEGFTANVYLDNKKIGTCADYADGGLLNTCIEWDENIKKRLEKSFQKHTRVDTFELYKNHITIEEYLKLKEKNELPICKYDNKYEMMEDICNNLYFLEMLESDYKNALKKRIFRHCLCIFCKFISCSLSGRSGLSNRWFKRCL